MRKTIIFVTHDIDEALRMGDRIALLSEGGRLEQYDTPAAILAAPASEFVDDFLGAERGLKRLALIPVSEVKAEPGPVAHAGDTRARAAEVAARHGTDWVVVVDDEGMLRGWAAVDAITATVDDAPLRSFALRLQATDSLRAALDAMVRSHTGVAVRVRPADGRDHYEGILTQEILAQEIG